LDPVVSFLSCEGSQGSKHDGTHHDTSNSTSRNTDGHFSIIRHGTENSSLLLGGDRSKVISSVLDALAGYIVADTNEAIGIIHNAGLGNNETSDCVITECALTEAERLVANLGGIHATIHAIATNNDLTSSSGLANKGLVRTSGGKVAVGTIADVESASVSVIANRVIDSVSASSILGTSVVGARVVVLTVGDLKNTSSLSNLASNRCTHVGSGEVGAIIQSVDTLVSLRAS